MPDCSKKSSRPSGVSRNSRSVSRPCVQTGARCTDRQKFCCLSSAEIEGRINRLQEKMLEYNRELRDKVDEINREPRDGPMDAVLKTVVEMTTQYERPIRVNGMANGVGNGVPYGARNGVPNGVGNRMPSGMGNRMPSGIGNRMPSGIGNRMPSGIGNRMPSGMGNGIPYGTGNGIPYGMGNGPSNRGNRVRNAAENDVPNGMANGGGHGIRNGLGNGNNSQILGEEDLAALIASALNRFRDEVIPDEERPRY